MEKKTRKIDLWLIAILILSIFLNFYHLTNSGTNEYYTVAVKSMMKNFHNFFYASFDSAGFITVDKPPVALWIQTLSAEIFGLHDWSVLLPEALAGVISVWLMYIISKPYLGRPGARIASLVLACTPIFVAVVRSNNVDSILIVTLLTATWALMRAVRTSKIGWLLLCTFLIGVGFNIKMMQAFMILPAVYLFYFIAAKAKWTKRILHLVIATVVLAVISLSWATYVDSVDKDKRPYIGSSQTNSVLELAFGYNGISRLTGETGQSGMGKPSSSQTNKTTTSQTQNNSSNTNKGNSQNQGNTPPNQGNSSSTQGPSQGSAPPSMNGSNGTAGFPGGGEMPNMTGGKRGNGGTGSSGRFNTGTAGPLRFFQQELSGQISWLLPFVLFVLIGLIALWRKTKVFSNQHKLAVFWFAWLIPMMVFFSIAGFFHQYYLSMLAPAIAGLVGIGWTVLSKSYKEAKDWTAWLFPVAILATFIFEGVILYQNKSSISSTWMALTMIVGIVLFILLVGAKTKMYNKHIALISLLAMLVVPFSWALTPALNGVNNVMPAAGPSSSQGGMGQPSGNSNAKQQMGRMPGNNNGTNASSNQENTINDKTNTNQNNASSTKNVSKQSRGMGMGNSASNKQLLAYMKKNYNGEKYILATQSVQNAYYIMENSDYAVMAMGGFSGSDPAMTATKLAKLAKAGEVKYFLVGGMGGMSNSSVTSWIKKNCKVVSASKWSGSSNASGTLYVYEGK